jgi:TorA maturation chaperone TorD
MKVKASSVDHEVSEVDLALCRATLYSALALGFRPPTEETIARLVSEDGSPTLADAAGIVEGRHDSEISSAARALAVQDGALIAKLSSLYRRLFGHTACGVVPPYETEYGAEALFQQPQELGDLMGFYHAFGLTLNRTEHERADHVSTECEFLSFLALKEAYALEHGDGLMLEETRKAARLFLRDHLGRFFPTFAKKLAREGRGGFYHALGKLGCRFITRECSRWSVQLGSESLSLRPVTDDRVPMACGSGGCLA